MMKIIISGVMLMILCGGSQLVYGEKLNCVFRDEPYYGYGLFYSCEVTSLVIQSNNLTIDGYLGEHEANKNDADVKAFWIHDTKTKFIPANLGFLFNLTTFRMYKTQLIEIKSMDFEGMSDLVFLHLQYNNLKSVPLDAFTTLTKLKIISLGNNQIEELPNEIFKNNLKLEDIILSNNNIKYLGAELFTDLGMSLMFVNLEGNICINEFYSVFTRKLIQLNEDIKMNCQKPDEVPATTTQTPMNADGIELKKSLSVFFDNLFTELLEANEKLKNQRIVN